MDAKAISKYLMVVGVILLLVAVGNFSGGGTAWASNSNQGCVPGTIPCPTATPSPPDGGSGGSGGGNTAPTSHIRGTVTDLSTNQPGAGIVVQINDVQVTTDSNGQYSLSGVAAGTYTVSLVLPGEFKSAQDPVTVQVDGTNDAVVDLGYYSAPQTAAITETMAVSGTAVVTATAVLPAPQTLPETGGNNGGIWFAVAGMLFIFGGIALRQKSIWH